MECPDCNSEDVKVLGGEPPLFKCKECGHVWELDEPFAVEELD